MGERAFDSAMAEVSEETLAELRALSPETDADRATMDAFVRDLGISIGQLIGGCLIQGGGG